MPYPNVTLTGLVAAAPAQLTLTTVPFPDPVAGELFNPLPITAAASPSFSVLVPDPTANGSGLLWTAVITVQGVEIYRSTVQIGIANGASQKLFALTPAVPPSLVTYLLQPTGTPVAGYVPIATGVGENSAWGPLGIQTTTFLYGSLGAIPSTGTFTAGTLAVDQNNILRVCTAGGTPGAWTRVGQLPWQFFIDDYGAKGDGQVALVNTVNGNATINTAPIGAPPAPALSNSASGGTVLAGTYQAKITYLNRYGETVASASASTTTSGSTSTLTLTPPNVAGSQNATGYNAYITLAGGNTYFKQNSTPLLLGQVLTLTAPPSGSGANPPGSDTTAAQIFTSTAVDGGKNVMICGSGGAIPGGPTIDTIATVVSPTSATLTTGASTVAGTVNGCALVFSSDDRIAIDNCVQAARTYALLNNYFAQVIGSAKIYGLGANLFQSTVASGGVTLNTQLRLPVPNPSGNTQDLEIHLLGANPQDASYQQFWMSTLPNVGPTSFVSYSVGPNNTPDPNFGWQSVIGFPTGGMGTGSNGFFNVKAVIEGVRVWQPGWSNSIGIDLFAVSGFQLRAASFPFAPATNSGGGVNPYNAWVNQAFWKNNKIGAGLRLPAILANQHSLGDSFATAGLNSGIVTAGDGAIFNDVICVSCDVPVKLTGIGGNNYHDLIIRRLYVENCNAGLNVSGGGGFFIAVKIKFDGENATIAGSDVSDPNNAVTGEFDWSDTFRGNGPNGFPVPTVTGAANLKMFNSALQRNVYGAPSYTLGTTFVNPWYHPMTLTLAGGTVTGISIGPHGGSLTSLGFTSGTFRLPSNWDINIAGSVKPTTFIAVPD